ncbi:1-phosphatidylinositol-4,5-bisphosphate phosphodiesterase 1 [Delitschia confertaspora ATCC 74209]|uniref:Phosphoinositide phospholipase C n=1 Tax=Delitschia confertaspora ATCC 74209 TaxID=1513339 RepID=A0A9P4JGC0_9PLEO|nr:1-phosphatidylinositol-4,5-bisphosphate phosphodiesterase 1 [Delitschia confertaspora ATCC 74209]
MGTNGSLQSTPEGLVPVSHSSLPTPAPLTLSESFLLPSMSTPPTSSPSTNAMAAAVSRGTGLIRRASRGAQQIPGRFRRKGSNAHRDSSSGPVIMRRRSDSRGVADAGNDVSDFDLNVDDDDADDDLFLDLNGEPINALGISSTRPSVHSLPEGVAEAPVRDTRLEQGTSLMKVTKKKRKDIKFRLDFDSAKVYWDSSRPSKQFYIDDVSDLRIGADARHYREECGFPESFEPFWFTIVCSISSRSKGRSTKTLHLVAPDKPTFELWTRTLDCLSRHRIEMMAGLVGSAEKIAKTVWRRAMEKKFEGMNHREDQELLDFAGVIQLCRSLHINYTEATLREHFAKADCDRTRTLNQAQFLYFVRRLKERKDVKQIFKRLAPTSGPEMGKEAFFFFLKADQGINVDDDINHWTSVFERYARASKPKATPPSGGEIPLPLTMSLPAFQAFLSSPANSVFAPASADPRLTRPLNEYFISSSHNTYLLGRQVTGESSTEAYINALQKGCRCIEIDCWDGSDGNPIVTHGRTLTKSISFSDTIKVINKYAFCESVYPLIISLEVHCSPEQQAVMTDIMVKVFGEKLILKPMNDSMVLPSPEELKHKILIKVKAAAEDWEEKLALADLPNGRRPRAISSPWSRPIHLNDSLVPNTPLLASTPSMSPPERMATFWTSPPTSTTSTSTGLPTPAPLSSAEDSDSPHVAQAEDKKRKKSKTSNIVKVLGDLGVYTRGIKFSSFMSHDANTYNHVFSFAERTFDKVCKPEAATKQLLEEHNMRCLMRVYPSGHRINSSNFDPMKFWRRGVQMAALNWQTYDLGQQINEAMFAAGDDRTGYVLKPAELREEYPSPVIGHRKKPKKRVKFSVDIISAQQLPRPRGLSLEANINPYVEFEMYSAEDKGRVATGEGGQDASARNGVSGIGQPLRKRTRIVDGNGYDPNWSETINMTLDTRYPSLVFVRWTVWNSIDGRSVNNTPLASFTAKLSSLQQGYRHLPLFDINGEQYLFSTLFCRIKREDFVEIDESSAPIPCSVESMNTWPEPSNGQSRRNVFRKVFGRTPSERKKRKEDLQYFDPREADPGFISRSHTLER